MTYAHFLIFIYSLTPQQNGHYLNNSYEALYYRPSKNITTHNSLKTFSVPHDSVWFNPSAKESLIHIKPIIDVSLAAGNNKNKFLYSSREGGSLLLTGQRLSVSLAAWHNISAFPDMMEKQIDSLQFIPRYGHNFTKKEALYSWFDARGNINFRPWSFLSLSTGRDKFFIGNGKRSLFLSDNSGAFGYFSTNLKIWHIQYINLVTFLKDTYTTDNNISYKRKYAVFHYISWNINPSLNVDFFESVVWKNNDSILHRGFDVNYLNPVIFMRPVEYSSGSTDNALIGLGLNIRFLKDMLFYSQFIIDEFYASEFFKGNGFFTNKYGMQAGIRNYNACSNKLKWLLEFNMVRPFTFSHYNSLQNYGNQRQPLAHPIGANFAEGLGEINILNNRIISTARLSFAIIGKDNLSENYGNDIYKNYWNVDDLYGHYLLQGIKTKQVNLLLQTGYLVKPEWNLVLNCGIILQKQYSDFNNDNYIYFTTGLKTLLYNDEWFK